MVRDKTSGWDITERNLDRNRGLQKDAFTEALKRASVRASDDEKEDVWPRTMDSSDVGDPYGYQLKPKGVTSWDHKPSTPQEESLYYGVHIHTESNPLGLHTHIPGSKIGGGHSHGPQNRFGAHHHRIGSQDMTIVDGDHTHDGKNYPDGGHEHCPDNFG